MKPNAMLISVGRGDTVDEIDLRNALDKGLLRRAVLDVFCTEPLPENHPFLNSKCVTLTPHSAWVTSQAIDRLLWSGLKLLKIHSELQK